MTIQLSKRFAILASTAGSVFKTVYLNTSRDEFDIDLVLVDRLCGALDFAKKCGIPFEIINNRQSDSLSDSVQDLLEKYEIDYVYLFFSRLLVGKLLTSYKNRLINFHPSLLPACPGLNGFEDTVSSGALLAGSTVHFIDSGVDTGPQLMQTVVPTYSCDVSALRHLVFAQQCAALFQIHQWIKDRSIELRYYEKLRIFRDGFVPEISEKSYLLYKKIASQLVP